MRKEMTFFFLSFLAMFGFTTVAPADESNDAEICAKGIERIYDKKLGDYRIRISSTNERTCQHLEILKNGHAVFHEEGIDHHYSLGIDDSGKYSLGNLIGRGTQLVVRRWTGGAHCCMSLLIFDLTRKFRIIAEIDGGNFDSEIVDLDHDGIPEIRVTDDFLAYRFSSFAYSATANVVLKYTHGRYSVAPEFTKKPPPPRKELNTKIPLWRKLLRQKGYPDWPPPTLIQAFTDLIFTGNKQIAFNLLDRAWPGDVSGKSEFLRSYQDALNGSRYYAELERKPPF